MITNQLEHFEGFALLFPIAAMLKISTLKRVQDRLDAIHLDDDDEEAVSDLPRISKLEDVSAFLNSEDRPALRVDLFDVDDNPFVLHIIYVEEGHRIETELEAPVAS